MRIVLNTHRDDPGTRPCITGLHRRLRERGIDATLNDWDHYDRYDVALFMAYDHDMERARQAHPGIRIGLADPKQAGAAHLAAARDADFLLVTGVEQRDAFLRHNRNTLAFAMFPPMPAVDRVHVDKTPIVVGYHGNRVHLECMVGSVTPALNALARVQPIEFWAIYNVDALGRARIGMPDEGLMKVRHIQWSAEMAPGSEVSRTFYDELRHVDVGILPNAMPVKDPLTSLETTAYDEPEFAYEPFDYLLRFKASCNAARVYPFARLGIPVVADFAPSSSQLIHDQRAGFIVSSPYGWYEALAALAASADLRDRTARELRRAVDAEYDHQLDDVLEICTGPLKSGRVTFDGVPSVDDQLSRWSHYERPQGASRLHRLQRRLKRALSDG